MITDNEFRRIVAYVKGNYGIDLSQKRVLVGGRLENYLVRNGYASCDEYIKKVESNPKGGEAVDLINGLTTNHHFCDHRSSCLQFPGRRNPRRRRPL